MAPISIELKIISCKDLRAFNFFQKLSVYATASIATEDSTKQYQRQKTPTDTEGDGNPEWNHKAQFDLTKFESPDLDNLFLVFDFISQGGLLLGEKLIGHVRVPIPDLLEDSSGALRFVSYQVVTSGGSPNGVLEFSYKVIHDKLSSTTPAIHYPILPQMYSAPPPPAVLQASVTVSYPPPVAIYPPVETSGSLYPPVETSSETWYPPPEVYYSPPAYFPAAEVSMHSYYPPPSTAADVYPVPPASYEEYGCSGCQSYPNVDPFRPPQPYIDGAWRGHVQSGGGYVGN